MQPLRPQPHLSPPGWTPTAPTCRAEPRPAHCLPSRMRPPPTPVPQNRPRIELYGLPAPRRNSASVATDTSLPRKTRVPSCCSSSGLSGNSPSKPARLGGLIRTPASGSIPPGAPTPTPISESVASPASSAAAPTACAIVFTTAPGPSSEGVGTRDCPSTLLRPSTTTIWILVPPRSTPARGGMAASIATSLRPGSDVLARYGRAHVQP